MNLNISIQTPKGLIKLTPDLTRESIIKALGYTPVDTEDIVIYESIDESDDSTFSIADNDGNVIAKFDKNGLTTTAINLKDDNSESSLITENSELSIMDDEGNIILKVNDKGVITTDITINGYSVLNHIKNTDIHITNENKEYWDNKLDSTSEDSELFITDNNGNIVLKVDNSGVNTGSLMVKGETVATENYVNSKVSVKANQSDLTSHTRNGDIHVTSKDKEYWDNKLDSTSEDSELSITDNNGNIVLKVDNSGVNTGSLMVKGETVATENYVNYEVSIKANQNDLTSLRNDFNTLVSGDTKTTIDNFNEVTSFLSGIEDTNTLEGILAGLASKSDLTSHTGNGDIHVTDEDKTKWNAVTNKANQSDLTSHTGNTNIHVTSEDKTKWNAKQDVITDLSTIRSNASKGATANEWGNHASAGYIKQEVLNQHINDTDLHLGDEIRLDENNKLLITDKDGNITLEVNENGLNSSNIYVDGEEVAIKTQLKTINNESIVGTGNIVVNAGQNGKSVDKVTQGTITDSNGYTNTPLTFYVDDTAINNQITIKAKNGKDGKII